MMEQFEEHRGSPALGEFRDRLGDELVRAPRSRKRLGVRSPRAVVVAALVFVTLGAGVAVAATQAIDQTPITVVEPNGETHPGVMNNAVVVACPDDMAVAIPEANPTSEAAKRDARERAPEFCQR